MRHSNATCHAGDKRQTHQCYSALTLDLFYLLFPVAKIILMNTIEMCTAKVILYFMYIMSFRLHQTKLGLNVKKNT